MNKCGNIPCQWWWCNEHGECLHYRLSCRNKPVAVSSDASSTLIVRSGKSISKIDQFNKNELEKNKHSSKVIRCTNIYCATTENITQHHLIPKPYRKGISGRIERMYLCEDCHKRVHRLKTNGELASFYNTKEAIKRLLASDLKFRIERMLYTYEGQMERAVA